MIIYRSSYSAGQFFRGGYGPWNMTFYSTIKKTSDDPVYWVIKTNFKKEKQTFYIYFSFPKSISRNTNEIQVMMASHIWMNKIWRTPKILRHFLLKQVLVFACPWINKSVPLVRSNSLAPHSVYLFHKVSSEVKRWWSSCLCFLLFVPACILLEWEAQLKNR